METPHLPHLCTPLHLAVSLGTSLYDFCGDKAITKSAQVQASCGEWQVLGPSVHGPVAGSVWRMSCDLLHDAGKSEHTIVCEALLFVTESHRRFLSRLRQDTMEGYVPGGQASKAILST